MEVAEEPGQSSVEPMEAQAEPTQEEEAKDDEPIEASEEPQAEPNMTMADLLEKSTDLCLRLRGRNYFHPSLEEQEKVIEGLLDDHLYDRLDSLDFFTLTNIMYTLQQMVVDMENKVPGRHPYITQTVATTSLVSYLRWYCCAFRTRPRPV